MSCIYTEEFLKYWQVSYLHFLTISLANGLYLNATPIDHSDCFYDGAANLVDGSHNHKKYILKNTNHTRFIWEVKPTSLFIFELYFVPSAANFITPKKCISKKLQIYIYNFVKSYKLKIFTKKLLQIDFVCSILSV